MVTRYSGYIHTPATRATGYVEDPHGTYVLATDYAAIEAERDEWKRRCERYEAIERADNETLHEFADYLSSKRAIAEGRDNG